MHGLARDVLGLCCIIVRNHSVRDISIVRPSVGRITTTALSVAASDMLCLARDALGHCCIIVGNSFVRDTMILVASAFLTTDVQNRFARVMRCPANGAARSSDLYNMSD